MLLERFLIYNSSCIHSYNKYEDEIKDCAFKLYFFGYIQFSTFKHSIQVNLLFKAANFVRTYCIFLSHIANCLTYLSWTSTKSHWNPANENWVSIFCLLYFLEALAFTLSFYQGGIWYDMKEYEADGWWVVYINIHFACTDVSSWQYEYFPQWQIKRYCLGTYLPQVKNSITL